MDKKLKFYVINGYEVAEKTGMGARMNTIMQTAFFAISGILPRDQAIAQIKQAIEKTYGKRGEAVVKKNFAAVDGTIENLFEVKVPAKVTSKTTRRRAGPGGGAGVCAERDRADAGLRWRRPARQRHADRWHLPHRHHAVGKAQHRPGHPRLGDPTCASSAASASWSARTRSSGRRSMTTSCLAGAPATFKHMPSKFKEFSQGMAYTVQVAPEDCTGCELCVEVCPAKDKTQAGRKALNMAPQMPLRESEAQTGSSS